MKFAIIILFATFIVGCERESMESKAKEVRMPSIEIFEILKKNLPTAAVDEIDFQGHEEEQYFLVLTVDQFETLQHQFTNQVEQHARSEHSYDRFASRATTFEDGFASFSFSLGEAESYHYIITGSFLEADGHGKVVIWIKPTQG
ncbi:hypothetical protein N9891_00470 [bacterium]|nr:hypothetical protein [bacterium]